jgi:hypothetical protein
VVTALFYGIESRLGDAFSRRERKWSQSRGRGSGPVDNTDNAYRSNTKEVRASASGVMPENQLPA